MTDRRGEKIGWTGGLLGGFIWVVILSVVLLFQGGREQAVLGFVITGIAVFSILYFSPWRHPSTPYWKLMLLPYATFFVSVAWGIWSSGGVNAMGMDWWTLPLLLLLLIPFGSLYRKRWSDFDALQKH